jgi:isorenieratene synthase
MNAFLEYDRASTSRDLDGIDFATWSAAAGLPPRLKRVLTIFARAFFGEEGELSTAEVIKAFHFYYLAHDRGLLYDYPTKPYAALVDDIEAHLRASGVEIVASRAIGTVETEPGGFLVDGRAFDDLILAAPARTVRDLFAVSPGLASAASKTARKLRRIQNGRRYAVWRIWIDRDARANVPVFVSTELAKLLDAVAFYHRITEADAAWVRDHGGAVLELHSYAVPDGFPTDDDVRDAMRAELPRFFPELEGMRIRHEHLRVRDDFTALHVGSAASRPETRTDHPRLQLAGDWVALPIPAMLMEGAFSSGLFAANAILAREGLREVPIESVPLRGLLARGEAVTAPSTLG